MVGAVVEGGRRTPRPLHDAAAMGKLEPLIYLCRQGTNPLALASEGEAVKIEVTEDEEGHTTLRMKKDDEDRAHKPTGRAPKHTAAGPLLLVEPVRDLQAEMEAAAAAAEAAAEAEAAVAASGDVSIRMMEAQKLAAGGAEPETLTVPEKTPLKILVEFDPGYDVWDPSKELRGHDVDERDRDGRVALHFACAHGRLEVVQTLLQLGADTNIPDVNGQTPLHFAASAGHHDIVEVLISLPECNATHRDNFLQTALHVSVRSAVLQSDPRAHGERKCARLLREHPSGDAAGRMRDIEGLLPAASAPTGYGKQVRLANGGTVIFIPPLFVLYGESLM
jgi:hypothetical protein